MFTGIVEALGTVRSLRKNGQSAEVTISSDDLDFSDVAVGDSIACSGVCLTVTGLAGNSFTADVSHETVERTVFKYLAPGAAVNLEKALTPGSRMGGHIVQGHVDGVGRIAGVSAKDGALDVWIEAPEGTAKYVAMKGSVAVNGISLTVNEVRDDSFRLTLIPHTRGVTTAAAWKKGDLVNVEVDVLARYVERLLACSGKGAETKRGLTAETLFENGFMR